jgi:hypothetical protein
VSAPSTDRRLGFRGVVGTLAACLCLGVLLGAAWRLLAPVVVGWSDPAEAAIATDGTLAVLAGVLGLVHGTGLVVRHPQPSLSRVLLSAAGSCLGAVVATVVGLALDVTETFGLPGAAFLWPACLVGVVGFAAALRYALSSGHSHD